MYEVKSDGVYLDGELWLERPTVESSRMEQVRFLNIIQMLMASPNRVVVFDPPELFQDYAEAMATERKRRLENMPPSLKGT